MTALLKLEALSKEELVELFSAAVKGTTTWQIPAHALDIISETAPTPVPPPPPPLLQLPLLYEGVHLKSEALADLTGDLQKFLLGDPDRDAP